MHDANRRQLSNEPSLVARCPKCNTAFRVTYEQCLQAEGRVRCGVCLNVFDVNQAAHQPLSTTNAATSVSLIRDANNQWFECTGKGEGAASLAIEPADESWALALLSELEEGIKRSLPEKDHTTSLASHLRSSPTEKPPAKVDLVESSGVFEDLKPQIDKERPQPSQVESSVAEERVPSKAILTDTVKGNWLASEHLPQKRRFPWLMVNSLLMILSLMLFVWYHWPTLSRRPQFFLITEWVCQLAGCEIPARRDWSALSLSLKVRRHPEQANSLEANALLTNHAPFAQSFPWISLEFSDINGATLEQFRFAPDDYLKGEMSKQYHLPANQSAQIVLVLPDPGKRAVNYRAYVEKHY